MKNKNVTLEFDDKVIYPKAQDWMQNIIFACIREPFRKVYLKDLQEHLRDTERYIVHAFPLHDEHLKYSSKEGMTWGGYMPEMKFHAVFIDGRKSPELPDSFVSFDKFHRTIPPKHFIELIKSKPELIDLLKPEARENVREYISNVQ